MNWQFRAASACRSFEHKKNRYLIPKSKTKFFSSVFFGDENITILIVSKKLGLRKYNVYKYTKKYIGTKKRHREKIAIALFGFRDTGKNLNKFIQTSHLFSVNVFFHQSKIHFDISGSCNRLVENVRQEKKQIVHFLF